MPTNIAYNAYTTDIINRCDRIVVLQLEACLNETLGIVCARILVEIKTDARTGGTQLWLTCCHTTHTDMRSHLRMDAALSLFDASVTFLDRLALIHQVPIEVPENNIWLTRSASGGIDCIVVVQIDLSRVYTNRSRPIQAIRTHTGEVVSVETINRVIDEHGNFFTDAHGRFNAGRFRDWHQQMHRRFGLRWSASPQEQMGDTATRQHDWLDEVANEPVEIDFDLPPAPVSNDTFRSRMIDFSSRASFRRSVNENHD